MAQMPRSGNAKPRIRGDKLVLAMLSVLRTLIFELDKAGALSGSTFLTAIDDTVVAHREHGNPNQLADAIEAIASHIQDSMGHIEQH
jgi:hypothetical protein